jgi:hypothetical protein
MCWANKSTTMGFVNAGIFDDIEDDIGQVAKDAVHGTEVIAYKASRINGVKFALLLVAGCLDDNVLSEQITF